MGIKRESAPPRNIHAEHLFKLNEAVFNLPEEDTVDKQMAAKLFATVEKIRSSHHGGKYDNADSNFFYDYLALLGTMQNQHFFNQAQTEQMLGWIKDTVDDGTKDKSAEKASKAKDEEIDTLKKKIAKLEDEKNKLEEWAYDDSWGQEQPSKSSKKKKAAEPVKESPP